jgi:hypothetical protein
MQLILLRSLKSRELYEINNLAAIPEHFESGPSPVRKLRPDASSEMGMGRIFSARNNRNFFQPGPNPA